MSLTLYSRWKIIIISKILIFCAYYNKTKKLLANDDSIVYYNSLNKYSYSLKKMSNFSFI